MQILCRDVVTLVTLALLVHTPGSRHSGPRPAVDNRRAFHPLPPARMPSYPQSTAPSTTTKVLINFF